MNKKPIIGGIILAAIIGVVFAGAQINPDNPENEKSPNSEVWSIRMASPEWDDRQSHRAALPKNLEEGTYKLGFVPMGDSPHKITIVIKGKSTTTSPNFYFIVMSSILTGPLKSPFGLTIILICCNSSNLILFSPK